MHICQLPISLPRNNSKASGIYIVDLVKELNVNHDTGLVHFNPLRIGFGKDIKGVNFLYIVDKLIKEQLKYIEKKFVREKFFFNIVQKRDSDIWVKETIACFDKYVNKYGTPDVLHCHSSRGAGEAARAISIKYKIPYILSEHNPIFLNGKLTKKDKERLEIIYSDAAFVCLVSRKMNRSIKDIVDKTKLKIVPNFISGEFNYNENRTIKGNNRNITIVGRLDSNKNTRMAVEALRLIKNKIDCNLNIVGEGDKEGELRNLVKKYNLNDYVTFYGYLSKGEISSLLNKSDLLFLCSEHESFGVPVIEALACGCHVVSTDCSGPVEISEQVEGISIITYNDFESMATEGMKLMENLSRNLEYRKNISENAIKKYGKDSVIKLWEDIYKEAIYAFNK